MRRKPWRLKLPRSMLTGSSSLIFLQVSSRNEGIILNDVGLCYEDHCDAEPLLL